MRELKFRAWDKEDKKLRYDVTGFEHGRKNEMKGIFLDGDYFAMENNPVMQYTGLTDKNGKEIYEGDIIEFKVFESDKNFKFGEVFFKLEGSLGWAIKVKIHGNYGMNSSDVFLYRTIGNIYENPELMESINND